MSAPRVSVLRWAGATSSERIGCQLQFGGDGRLVALTRTAGAAIVAGLGPVGAVVDGRWAAPTGVRAEVSDDEVEQTAELGELRLRVRHNLDRTWQVRVHVHNPTGHEVVVDRIGWEATPGADARVVVHAAGALATVAFCQVAGPVLALRVSRGELVSDADGLACPPLRLAPGGSWAVTLQGEWYADLADVWATLPAWFPETALDLVDADDFALDHPDAAVTASGAVEGPGVRRLAVADARGTSLVEVAIAPGLGDEAARVADAVAARGRVGTAAEGVALALGGGGARADELLDDYAERTPDGPSALQVCLWARLAVAGRAGMFARALDTAGRVRPGPGTGLAAVALWTAAAVAGEDPGVVAGAVARLVRAEASPLDPVTVLELAGPAGRRDAVVGRAAWEVGLLSAALPAEPWPRRADAELARAAAVRALAGDPCVSLRRHLLARCADRPDATANAEVLAWLGFGG